MRYSLTLALAILTLALAIAHPSNVRANACPEEDSPAWNWVRCGNGARGVITMWGTPKVVTCGDMRWLVRHGDLDPHTPWIVGDYSCGRRHRR